MTGPDGRRVVAVADGRDKGVVGELCDQPGAHGGDRSRITDVTRDPGGAFGSGAGTHMPQACQTADRSRVTRPLAEATDRTRNLNYS